MNGVLQTGRHAVNMVAQDFELWREQLSVKEKTFLGVCYKHKHMHKMLHFDINYNYIWLYRSSELHTHIDTRKLPTNVGKVFSHLLIPKAKNLGRNCGRVFIEVSYELVSMDTTHCSCECINAIYRTCTRSPDKNENLLVNPKRSARSHSHTKLI